MNFSSMALLGMVPMRMSHNFGEEVGWAPLRPLQLQSFKMKRFCEEGGRKGAALKGMNTHLFLQLVSNFLWQLLSLSSALPILADHLAGDTVLDLLLGQW